MATSLMMVTMMVMTAGVGRAEEEGATPAQPGEAL